jgi:uncharacterized protein YkwD
MEITMFGTARGMAMIRAVAAILLGAALMVHPGKARADELDHIRAEALALVNASRKAQSLPPLTLALKLTMAAQFHASDMLKRSYFAHASPEGKTLADRYRAAGGSRWLLTAENIAYFSNKPAPVTDAFLKMLQESWMNSPGHRKNILLKGITEFGFGLAVDATGHLYAVQTFAGPGSNRDDHVAAKAGGPAEAKSSSPAEAKRVSLADQATLALAAINAERKKAGRAALSWNEALRKCALAMMPAKGEENFGLQQKDLLDFIPASDGQSWAHVSAVSAACGGCGIEPVRGDIGKFVDQWIAEEDYRAMLINADATHLGFAIGADGAGKKVAIGVLGKRDTAKAAK